MVYSPATKTDGWYFAAAVTFFLGALVVDGVSLTIGLSQPPLFHLSVYFLAALCSYLALFHFYVGPQSSPGDQLIFAVVIIVGVLAFVAGPTLLGLSGVLLLAIAGWYCWRIQDFAAQVGLSGLALIGAWLVVGALLDYPVWLVSGHDWLGGANVVVWVSAYSWYLGDSGRARPEQIAGLLKWTMGLVITLGLAGIGLRPAAVRFGWTWPLVASVLNLVEACPLIVICLRQVRLGWAGYWEQFLGWLVLAGFLSGTNGLLHWRAMVWPLLVVGLVLAPRRHRRRLLGLVPWGGRQPNEKMLRVGAGLLFYGLWTRVAVLYLAGNVLFIFGYLRFGQGLVAKPQKPPPGGYSGEGHII